MTDPIADMLTRLRNAVIAKHARVDVPVSKLKVEIAKILEDEGYIQGFKLIDEKSPEAAKAAAPANNNIKIGNFIPSCSGGLGPPQIRTIDDQRPPLQ